MKLFTLHPLYRFILLLTSSIFLSLSCFAYDTTDFVITVKTDNPGASASHQFTIPTNHYYYDDYNYSVDCDAMGILAPTTLHAVNLTGNYTCDYTVDTGFMGTVPVPGTYKIAISGKFPTIQFSGANDPKKILAVDQWGTQPWKTMNSAFSGATYLHILADDTPDLSSVLDMGGMFNYTDAFNENINNWDVSNVVSMRMMFYFARAFNQDLDNWDVSKVTNMESMFLNANSFNKDIGNWDVSIVSKMQSMFWGADLFNQDIGNWDVSKVTNMQGMFNFASAFDQDLGDWDISEVTDMTDMLGNIKLSISNYDNLLLSWSKLSVSSSVNFNAGDSQYSQSASSKTILEDAPNSWTITDADINPTNLRITTPNYITVTDAFQIVTTITSTYNLGYTEYEIVPVGDGNMFNIGKDSGRLNFKILPKTGNIYRVQIKANNIMQTSQDLKTIRVEFKSDATIAPIIMYLLN